jgi:hypothetical protein
MDTKMLRSYAKSQELRCNQTNTKQYEKMEDPRDYELQEHLRGVDNDELAYENGYDSYADYLADLESDKADEDFDFDR